MNTPAFNLEAKRHTSHVLANWAQSRPGAAQRMVGSLNNLAVVSSDNDAMRELFQPITSASGYAVTDKTAMAVSTVYACLTKLAGAVLQLPVHQFRIDAKGERDRVRNTALHWMLNEQPHAMWTSASWKEWIVRCVALRGDQHTEILRSSNSSGGQIIGLEPHHPDCVTARQVNKRLVYDVMDATTGKVRTVDQDDMLHFAGFGFNGLHSLSAIQHAAKQSIGNSLAAADYSGRAVGSGEMPQITIQSEKVLSPKQTQELRENFVAIYTGKGSSKLPLVLTEGVKANVLGISPVDMQLIESRKYEKEDICQALGVPPIIIGDSDKASSWGTGIEQITLGFVRFTIKPMLCRWEEEINRKFFRNAGSFVEFELDGLLRGDSKAQSEVFKAALGGPGAGDAYMTVNEVRKLKNLPPIAGGDELFKAQRSTDPAATPNTNGATA